MSKKINIILFLIVSTLVISIVYIQSSFQHWSAQWDLDFWYIYNASLMSSGIQQEWYDHPATTILSFYSIFYKIYSLVDHSFIYKINEIMNSDDPNLVLQKLYFVTRIFDKYNLNYSFYFQDIKTSNVKRFIRISTDLLTDFFFNVYEQSFNIKP